MHTRLKHLEVLANSKSYERRRAEYQGFQFGRFEIIEDQFCGPRLHGFFLGLCGRVEQFVLNVHLWQDLMDGPIENPVKWLAKSLHSFDRVHLKEDGYTEEQIVRIETLGNDFDLMMHESQRHTHPEYSDGSNRTV